MKKILSVAALTTAFVVVLAAPASAVEWKPMYETSLESKMMCQGSDVCNLSEFGICTTGLCVTIPEDWCTGANGIPIVCTFTPPETVQEFIGYVSPPQPSF